MFRKNAWCWAALTVAGLLGPGAVANASEPPSTKVARWHDEFCPRDLTPFVTGPCYGFYPTRWRIMPPCDEPVDLVLPPTVLKLGKPAPGKGIGGTSSPAPSPYGAPARTALESSPRGEWMARPAAARETRSFPVPERKTPWPMEGR